MSKREFTDAQELAFAWESVGMPLDAIAEMHIELQKRQPKPDAHELWAVAQLLPGEGIEDGVGRIEELLGENK